MGYETVGTQRYNFNICQWSCLYAIACLRSSLNIGCSEWVLCGHWQLHAGTCGIGQEHLREEWVFYGMEGPCCIGHGWNQGDHAGHAWNHCVSCREGQCESSWSTVESVAAWALWPDCSVVWLNGRRPISPQCASELLGWEVVGCGLPQGHGGADPSFSTLCWF